MNQNILFIIPSYFFIEDYQRLMYYNDIPIGTLQISSFLRERNAINTDIIDLRVEEKRFPKLKDIESEFENFKRSFIQIMELNNIQEYDNVGINCYTSFQYHQTLLIGDILREMFPKINLIVGGYHPSAAPSDFAYKNSPFNYIIRGEAESTLLELFKSSNLEKTRSNTFTLQIKKLVDINKLPFPDYELYLNKYPYQNNFKFDLFSSRGCVFQCNFCGENYDFRSNNLEIFKRNFSELIKIVEIYNKERLKISFADQIFNYINDWQQILEFLITNDYNEVFEFSCQCRIDSIRNKEILKNFQRANFIIGFGLESINKRMLKEMNKTNNFSKYINSVINILEYYKENTEKYCRLNIVIGFPGETQKSFNETVTFLQKHALNENIQITPNLFSNYPNTPVYNNMDYYRLKFGTIFIKEWWKIKSNPFKNSVLEKPSREFLKRDLIYYYKEYYAKILKCFKKNTILELVIWKKFFNKWYKELLNLDNENL